MAYKKIASSFGKFLFFEKEESTALSSGRLCISTKSHQLISETVQVDIKNESFEEVDHVSESNDEQPIDDFEILQTKLNNMDEQAFDNELGTEGDKKDGENRELEDVVGDCFHGEYLRPQDHVLNVSLWNRLTDFMHHHNGSYYYVVNMNAVRNETERFGYTLNSFEDNHFNSFMIPQDLVDLPIGGRSFSWMNKAGTMLSNLNRFLYSEDVDYSLTECSDYCSDRLWSDQNLSILHMTN
ncbi:hypothetical protein Tco_0270399 [Tanacetum coccineum]